ncbi:MAG: hypothetical protein Q8830_03640, partial [Candidatus Phytoplasma australasiaticum]|nr:hypothetical protein [Candidatus Phytoplasma australasiaticum]
SSFVLRLPLLSAVKVSLSVRPRMSLIGLLRKSLGNKVAYVKLGGLDEPLWCQLFILGKKIKKMINSYICKISP